MLTIRKSRRKITASLKETFPKSKVKKEETNVVNTKLMTDLSGEEINKVQVSHELQRNLMIILLKEIQTKLVDHLE